MTLLGAGNIINPLNGYVDESVHYPPKVSMRHYQGLVYVPNTDYQTTFTIYLPSRMKDTPDLPMVLPIGANVYYIGLATGDNLVQLTSTDRIKVATAIGATGVSVNPGAAQIPADLRNSSHLANPYDMTGASAPLGLQASPLTLKLFSTTSGLTSLGTGLKSAKTGIDDKSYISVDVCWWTWDEATAIEGAYRASFE